MEDYMIPIVVIPMVFVGVILFCWILACCKVQRAKKKARNRLTTAQLTDINVNSHAQQPVYPQQLPFPPQQVPAAPPFTPPTQPDGTPLPYYVVYVPVSSANSATAASSNGNVSMQYFTAPANDLPPKYEDLENNSNANRY